MIKSKKIRDSAKGEECTLQIGGICDGDNDTVVLCHFGVHSGGSARLNGDLSAGYGCMKCHNCIDRREYHSVSEADREFYMRRSMVRTLTRLFEKGLLEVK